MALLAVIGESARVEGWALAGALVVEGDTADEVRAGWAWVRARDVAAVLLTPAAAQALAADLGRETGGPLVAVLPC
jgi:vacuolar-type H+-ATPase subunit F/Vma7